METPPLEVLVDPWQVDEEAASKPQTSERGNVNIISFFFIHCQGFPVFFLLQIFNF
jgi:hypothetical protein